MNFAGVYHFFLWLFRRRRRFDLRGQDMLEGYVDGDRVTVDNWTNSFGLMHEAGEVVVVQDDGDRGRYSVRRVAKRTHDGFYYLHEVADAEAFNGPIKHSRIMGKVLAKL